jgi:small nuclear ribonucleoprotein (snRNP)-like protein
VTVELKNDLAIRGTLLSVDQYLNIKLENTRVVDQDKYPHMVISRFFFLILLFSFRVLVLNVYLATTLLLLVSVF